MTAAVTKRYLKPILEKRKPHISLRISEEVPRQAVPQGSRNEDPVKKHLFVVLGSQQVFVVHDDVVISAGDEEDEESHHPEDPRPESSALIVTIVASPILHRHYSFLPRTLLVLEDHGYHHHEAGQPDQEDIHSHLEETT